MEKRDVLKRLAEVAFACVNLLTATEQRHSLKTGLVIDPLGPQPSVGFEEAEAYVGYRQEPGLDEAMIEIEAALDLDHLTKAAIVEPNAEVWCEDHVRLQVNQLSDDDFLICPEPFKDPVHDVEFDGYTRRRPEPIDLTEWSPVLGGQAAAVDAEEARAVESDPGNIDLIRIVSGSESPSGYHGRVSVVAEQAAEPHLPRYSVRR